MQSEIIAEIEHNNRKYTEVFYFEKSKHVV